MARRRNTVRADGRIAVQIYLGRDENGKRKYKTVYGTTQKEADAKAEAVKAKIGKGLDILSQQDTVRRMAEALVDRKANTDRQRHTNNVPRSAKTYGIIGRHGNL